MVEYAELICLQFFASVVNYTVAGVCVYHFRSKYNCLCRMTFSLARKYRLSSRGLWFNLLVRIYTRLV
jgi:hypothetical protein